MPNTRPWVVLKFGGTSVSTPERWATIADEARQRLDEGLRPLVVCSAVSGVTDAIERLMDEAVRGDHEETLAEIEARHDELAEALGVDGEATWQGPAEQLRRLALGLSLVERADPALRARGLACGELMSTRIGAAYLDRAVGATWLDARTLLRAETDPHVGAARRYLSAGCAHAPDAAVQQRLGQEVSGVGVTQGFIASDAAGDTVLLGRGGSDASAAYLAGKLEAARLEIWTDVPGLFTADPRTIPSARLLRHLDYDEAQELATMGAKVLHPRCIAPVRQQQIPLHLRSTPAPSVEGTVVSGEAPSAGPQVKALSTKGGLTLVAMRTLGMWQRVGFLADVFGVFKAHGLSVDLVATSETDVTVSLDPLANVMEDGVVDALLEDLQPYCRAELIHSCTAVSLVGRDIRALLHRLTGVFEVFEEQRVHLLTQAASDLNLTFVVDEEQAPRLVRELHAQLFGAQPEGGAFGLTWRALFAEAPEEPVGRTWWRDRRDELLQVAEDRSPVYVYDEPTLRTAVGAIRSMEALDRVFYAVKANAHPGILRLFEEAGLGFECVSPGEVDHVREVLPGLDPGRILFTPNFAPRAEYAYGFAQGIHVTLDNLHPLEAWPDVFAGQDLILRVDPGFGRGHHAHVRTAGEQSKFGIAPGMMERVAEQVAAVGARVVGLHAHVGSGIVTTETWAQTAVFLTGLAGRFPDLRFVNVGGGLGVAEHPEAAVLDLSAVAESLAAFKEAHPGFELWMEPGRFLVAHAGVLLARVTQVKQKSAHRHYVGLETGMNSLVRPALYGSYHEIRNLSRLDAPDAMVADVVGPICESGDVLGHDRRLPVTEEGDVLLVASTGAYGYSMRSNYNLRAPAGEVLLPARAGTE